MRLRIIIGAFPADEPPPRGVAPEKDPRFLKGRPSDGFLTNGGKGAPIRPLSDPLCSSLILINFLNVMIILYIDYIDLF
jgi:hypothetical protein